MRKTVGNVGKGVRKINGWKFIKCSMCWKVPAHILRTSIPGTGLGLGKLDRKHYVILLNKWTNFRPCGCLLLWLLWGTCCITVGKMFSIIKIPYHGAQMSHSGKHVVEKLVKNFLLRVNRQINPFLVAANRVLYDAVGDVGTAANYSSNSQVALSSSLSPS